MRVSNEQAAVVGAGRMGHGIALELARGGYRVAIFDAKTGRASTAITEAERDASDLVEAGVIGQGDIPKIIQRLSAEADLKTAVTGARVVFEAVAEDLEIKVIMTMTHSGSTARMISRYRPNSAIYALTPFNHIVRQLQLVWGIQSIKVDNYDNVENIPALCNAILNDLKAIDIKDQFVITGGVPMGIAGTTNYLSIQVHE